MCGFLARFNPIGQRVDVHECRRATAALVHRGPDAHGEWVSQERDSYLGFRRLSIIDLSPAANQPMAGNNDNFLVFNGEIYNYREIRAQLQAKGIEFRTSGDTEVLLRALEQWGQDALHRIEGMFAFVYWNNHSGEALAARDFLGIKPFYFWLPPSGGICMTSEIKSLFSFSDFNPQVNNPALAEYLRFRSLTGSATLLKGVLQLSPGHLLCYSGSTGRMTTKEYWNPVQVIDKPIPISDARDSLHSQFIASVDKHLLADVPVGAQLSGGVDSSLSVAIARRVLNHNIKGFHCSVAEPTCDESHFARLVAHELKVDLEVVSLSSELVFSELLDKLTWHMDEPLGHSNSIGVYLVSALAQPQVKVLISGEAADELFAGYHRYSALLFHERLRRHALLPTLVRQLPYANVKYYRAMKSSCAWASMSSEDEIIRGMQALTPETVGSLLGPKSIAESEHSRRAYFRTLPKLDLLTQCQLFDIATYLPALLIRQDKMSMAASIENRVPFATPSMARIALNLTPEFRATIRKQKIAVKSVLRKYLPKPIVYRRKLGFGLPLARWFATPAGIERRSWLARNSCPLNQYLDSKVVKRLLDTYQGTELQAEALWLLLTLGIWLALISTKPRVLQNQISMAVAS